MTNSNEGNQESALTTNQHFSPASDFFPVAVIVPPVVCHDLDPHTGIPFMPHIAGHALARCARAVITFRPLTVLELIAIAAKSLVSFC